MMAGSYEERRREIAGSVEADPDYLAARERRERTDSSKPAYAGSYENDLADAYNRILSLERFSYDLDDDALFQQFADRYMSSGKLAMQDSMGQAAALTGGYGSSYGQAVGQQTYDAYLQALGDRSLEMVDRAYARYQDEAGMLKDRYALASDMADTEYGRYADQLRQYNSDRAYASAAENEAWSRAYKLDSDAWSRTRTEEDAEYERQMDYAKTLAAYGDFSGYAEVFGGDRASEMQKVWNAGNYDLAYNSGKITAEEYRAMTGKWPPGYKTGGGGGTLQSPKNRYESVLSEILLLNSGGSSTGAIQGTIDAAYGSGAITKDQREQLTGQYGSGKSGGSLGNTKRPGEGMGLA